MEVCKYQVSDDKDLRTRCTKFGSDVVRLCRTLRQDAVSRPIISQLVRSTTSVGANYLEARSACSRKDFRHKMYLCKKEINESAHWLLMLDECFSNRKDDIDPMQKECYELIKIFERSTMTIEENDNKEVSRT